MQIDNLLSGYLSGRPLELAALALRQPRLAALGAEVLRRELGIHALTELVDGSDSLQPDVLPRAGRPPRTLSVRANPPESPEWALTSEALTHRYRKRQLSPEELLTRLLSEADRLAERQPWLRCIWMRDEEGARTAARESAERYARGQPLGPLDGVPVLVKEQLAVARLSCRLGHDLPEDVLPERDATVVARLRAEGALIVGQTAMTELGLSPLGINPKRPPLRNPHHVERMAGGSSTGSGIAVSVGLVPIAGGADGGGSVRIPASLCGVFGLKPSFGRVSRAGDAYWGNLSHEGSVASSCRDLALFFDAVSGPDPEDPLTLHAPRPPVPLAAALGRGVRGLRVGVDAREWGDAQPEVQRAGQQALAALAQSGVELVDVSLALAPHAAAIGFVTIAAEADALFSRQLAQYRDAYGSDTQVLLMLAAQLRASEFLHAQLLRERLRRQVAEVFGEVDALALPTTQRTALTVQRADDRTGRLDTAAVRALCRYTFLGNLTGLPAGSAPVGLDPEGLPIGLQIVGDAWDEATVIALMAELERIGIAQPARPPYHLSPFSEV